mmetsp:Transcript_15591/g.23024  ORF Transcript_15591/g.23024 Transcript_15591/m.23024 type:complete len:156 (-) Transcript_15591:1113-1580(-)
MRGAYRAVLRYAGKKWNVDTSVRIFAVHARTGIRVQRNAKERFFVGMNVEDLAIFQKIASLVIRSVMCVVLIQSALNFVMKFARAVSSRATGNVITKGSARWYVAPLVPGSLATNAAPINYHVATGAHRCVARFAQLKTFARNAATNQKGRKRSR